MNKYYPLKHWLLTLIIGPLFLFIYESLKGNSNAQILIHPFIVLVSAVFSIPALICYLILFDFLAPKKMTVLTVKIILILFSILTIIITFTLIGGEMRSWVWAYAFASIIIGAIFNIKKKPATTHNQEPV